jgi:hypothetical protein
MHRNTKRISLALLIAGIALLFVGGPADTAARSIQRAWDFGHVVLFFLMALVWIRSQEAPSNRSDLRMWCEILIAAAVLGIGIETVQSLVGRSREVGDVWRTVLGASLALAFGSPSGRHRALWIRLSARLATATLLLTALLPLARALMDERAASRAFPVLADFETPFQLDRWESDVDLSIETEIVRDGSGALRIPFSTERYSRASLKHFPGYWRGRVALRASIFNPGPDPLTLHLRVHDIWYIDLGQSYAQRFNRRFDLNSGWNDLEVSLADIAAGPAKRTLDLERIRGLSFFTIDLPQPRAIVLDQLELR